MTLTDLLMEKYGPFLDMQEIAEVLKLKKQSLYQQIYNGTLDIPHVKRGKKYLFPTLETAAYLEARYVS